jgi:hypothetical protein
MTSRRSSEGVAGFKYAEAFANKQRQASFAQAPSSCGLQAFTYLAGVCPLIFLLTHLHLGHEINSRPFGIEKFERGIERKESGEGPGQTRLIMRYQALGQIGGDRQLLQVEAV